MMNTIICLNKFNTLKRKELLIKQYVMSQPLSVYSIVDLDFNNNVKELIWTLFQTHYGESGVKKSCSAENNGGNQNIEVDSLFIQINGQDIIQEHPGKYFTDFQRYKYHSGQGIKLTRIGVNDDDVTSTRVLSKWFPRVINQHIFSFALKPEESQPSGSINFSLVDSSTMNIKFKTSAVDGRQSYDLECLCNKLQCFENKKWSCVTCIFFLIFLFITINK